MWHEARVRDAAPALLVRQFHLDGRASPDGFHVGFVAVGFVAVGFVAVGFVVVGFVAVGFVAVCFVAVGFADIGFAVVAGTVDSGRENVGVDAASNPHLYYDWIPAIFRPKPRPQYPCP